MDPRQFEDAVADLFEHNGFRVQQMPFVNDGGKDAIAWRDGMKFLIECKRYEREQAVHRRDMQILVAAMQDEGADGGYYVTTGRFTRPAVEYAPLHNITLVNGEALIRIAGEPPPSAGAHPAARGPQPGVDRGAVDRGAIDGAAADRGRGPRSP